jgi:non-heme Fe2+,alpha-ketoglutarate-dependent halogenase
MPTDTQPLTAEQIASYRELGYLDCLPVLSEDEVRKYRAAIDKTCDALGGHVTRLDDPHIYFRWAWELSMHPRLVSYLQQLLGPDIVLTLTSVFYKHGHTGAFVDWHQDGVTEEIIDGRIPSVWLGITEATAENGCLRVVPRSQHVGLIPHQTHPEPEQAPRPGWAKGHALGDELSGVFTSLPPGLEPPHDVVMRAGEMSVHHPVVFHGSNPNQSDGPRIGLSSVYSATALLKKPSAAPGSTQTPWGWSAVAVVCGVPPAGVELLAEPPQAPFEDEVAAYRASGYQIHY